MMGPDKSTTITDAKFSYAYWHGKTGEGKVRYGEDELLLTATEIAENIAGRRCAECYPTYEELKSRNAELEALLKEVMATRDEAIRQNNELIADCANWKEAAQRYHDSAKVADAAADELRKENRELKAKVTELNVENDNLKSDCNDWKDTADDRIVDVQNLTAERDNLKADLTTQKEVNEELKTKIADLRNRVGEQLAQIQDLNAEVHFHKEFGEGLDKQQNELQARYDELDSVNKEQAEKIRKLDKALADLKERNDKLQAENTNLTFLLEDAPEKETTKTLHVVLNDGTEIEFRRYTAYDYRTDINMFVVKDGEKYIAGFLRGDKPMNLAYWWIE
jgi:chromosome segregation ATPase